MLTSFLSLSFSFSFDVVFALSMGGIDILIHGI